MWCSDEPNALKACNNEHTYVTGVHFIVSWAKQIYRLESVDSPGHPLTADVLKDMIKATPLLLCLCITIFETLDGFVWN
jgi:hypothetical protein